MYNFDFLNNTEKQTVFVFHSETENVDGNIIAPVKETLEPMLRSKFFDRNAKESFLCLRYPDDNSPDSEFLMFFDSPTCASLMYSEFNGCFVVDCSSYDGISSRLEKLLEFIKQNASPDFEFIVLVRRTLADKIKKAAAQISLEAEFVNLELDCSVLDEFSSELDEESFEILKSYFDDNITVRTVNYAHFCRAVTDAVKNGAEIGNIILRLMREQPESGKERGIGF
ncbi:MAG: hypothetical protein E7514_01920 [Ruminococcaceae bacterium]|nr:hypothetical protein [Oscillospiraceae bacterium]